MKILLADDEPSLCESLGLLFQGDGYDVCIARDGQQAFELFCLERPDLAVVDVSMPKLDGFEVCEAIRRIDPRAPIIMLSARSDVIDRKAGFRAGADDYVVKPFDNGELLLRVRALLRRSRGEDAGKLLRVTTVGDLTIDQSKCEVTVDGRVAKLTPKEFQILALLAGSPGQVFTRDDIIGAIWGEDYTDNSISIPTYIRRLRLKIEPDPSDPVHIETVWRFGWRLRGDERNRGV